MTRKSVFYGRASEFEVATTMLYSRMTRQVVDIWDLEYKATKAETTHSLWLLEVLKDLGSTNELK